MVGLCLDEVCEAAILAQAFRWGSIAWSVQTLFRVEFFKFAGSTDVYLSQMLSIVIKKLLWLAIRLDQPREILRPMYQ